MCADPFSEANDESVDKAYIHVRTQQRNGKKSLTTVQGLKKEFSFEKVLKDLKKEFCCNGTVVQDKELGKVIQLQGDQRKNVSNFLVQVICGEKISSGVNRSFTAMFSWMLLVDEKLSLYFPSVLS